MYCIIHPLKQRSTLKNYILFPQAHTIIRQNNEFLIVSFNTVVSNSIYTTCHYLLRFLSSLSKTLWWHNPAQQMEYGRGPPIKTPQHSSPLHILSHTHNIFCCRSHTHIRIPPLDLWLKHHSPITHTHTHIQSFHLNLTTHMTFPPVSFWHASRQLDFSKL